MRSIDRLIKRLAEYDVQTTDRIAEAMYLLPDGRMISGNFDHGMRGDDHRAIFAGVDYGDMYESNDPGRTHWDRLHREYRVARLVPEARYALIRKGQRLTEIQDRMLTRAGYRVERY